MIWMVIGCRYQDCDVSVREKLSFSENQIRSALGKLRSRWPELEVVILSTCNRVEIYAALELRAETSFPSDVELGIAELTNFWAEFKGLSPAEVEAASFYRVGAEAVRHLFMVASSLDSMVVGEAQIAGQVQNAYQLAVECGSVGSFLHLAFQSAGKVARKVAAETTIHQYRTSVPSVAVSCFARQIFEHFENKRTLVIGAGKMAEETLLYLREEGVRTITIVNRNLENARKMADQFHGSVRPWEELDAAIIDADLIVSTTGSMEPIVTLKRFLALEKQRGFRPLFILDLAVPRDFDGRLAQLQNVYLYTVDDLQSVCNANQVARSRDFPKAKTIVDLQLQSFLLDIRHRKSGPIITELRQFSDQTKRLELERLFRKMPGLSEAERAEVAYSFDRLVNKLLHPTLAALYESGQNPENQRGLLNAVKKLFGLK